jgi:hypothetical protein
MELGGTLWKIDGRVLSINILSPTQVFNLRISSKSFIRRGAGRLLGLIFEHLAKIELKALALLEKKTRQNKFKESKKRTTYFDLIRILTLTQLLPTNPMLKSSIRASKRVSQINKTGQKKLKELTW